MPRGIRLYEKRRGVRGTVSKSAGRLGEGVFYGFFLLLGVAGIAYLLGNTILPEWRANRSVVESRCRVLDKRVGRQEQFGLARFRPEVLIQHEVDGAWRDDRIWTYDAANEYRFEEVDARSVIDQFEVGHEYPCWYDPSNPKFVVLTRRHWWPWILLIIAISFAVFGGVGVVYSLMHVSTSEERRLSHSTEEGRRDTARRKKKSTKIDYPATPSVENIVNSPGTRLEYRLPIDASPGVRLIGICVVATLWNGLVAYLTYHAIRGVLDGEPNWLLIAFLIPFVVGGIWLAITGLRHVLLNSGVGATRMEVDEHPFRPGGNYQIGIAQDGRLQMNRLEIRLVCEERATYLQGTDTRVERRRVHDKVVYSHDNFAIEPRAPFQGQFALSIPSNAMHSFLSVHNEVAWSLIATGDIAHWPDFERRFPICVYPTPPGAGPSDPTSAAKTNDTV